MKIKLQGGPHDGLDVTAFAEGQIHFFIYVTAAHRLEYYCRDEDDENYEAKPFVYKPGDPPCGAAGFILVISQ